ncbi:MAG TPA: hypothetical protein VHM91_25625, partial [Verrucomicrobiales bacterium]|nr:hypothetical protein [Verrucomicrobiales bacterium]
MAAPQTFFLKDTDGNNVADERTVLFSGWGKSDTHAGPSNIRYGFDGWIWGTVGYAGFNGVVGGEALRFGQGAYRFKPDGSKLEFLGPTSNNTWGMGINENGDVFGSTANGQSSWYLPIPWTLANGVDGFRIGDRIDGIDANKKMFVIMDKLRQVDFHGGFTSAAGHEIYTARSYPQDCWNKLALVTEPTGHVVYRAMLEQSGTDFSATNAWNLMAGADEWVAPVVATTGPDGAVWVSDWYSFLVQHNPTPNTGSAGFNARTGRGNAFVSELRDTEKCRLYRIAYKAGKPSQQFKLSKSDSAGLLAALKSDNLGWRMHAQRLLIESGNKAVVPELLKLIADPSTDAAGVNGAAINALWTLHGLGAVTDKSVNAAVVAALKHPSSGVRRAAMKVLPRDAESMQQIVSNGMLKDKEPLVRLTALLELCSLPGQSPELDKDLAGMMQDAANKKDKWLPVARTLALVRHGEGFLLGSIANAPREAAAPETVKPAAEEKNLFLNAGAEEAEGPLPAKWQVRTYNGQAKHSRANQGHQGTGSFFIQSDTGSDTSFHFDLDLEKNTDYVFSGWIKTDGLKPKGEGKGAMLEIHSLNGRQPFTKPLTGTNDWTRVELKFGTGGQRNVSFNLLYGGWGHATGSAWWDDLSLVKIGPSKGGAAGDLADPVEVVARNLGKFSGPDAVARVKEAATKTPSPLSTVILKALTSGPAAAAVEESEADLAKTHQVFRIKSTVGTLKYDVVELNVTAGKPVAIIYENPDALQHNLIIGAPGSFEKLGAAADGMMTNPQGFAKSFVPDLPEVLAKCKLLDPGQKTVIKFTPEKAGDYPFLCTFPAHWRVMHG